MTTKLKQMPTYTVKKFGELCGGIEPKNIYVYRNRNKVRIRKDGLIDSDHPLNKHFMETQRAKRGLLDIKSDENVPRGTLENDVNVPDNDQDLEQRKADSEAVAAKKEQDKLKSEKAKLELDMLRMKAKLQAGEMIGMTEAQDFMTVHFNSIFAIFHNAIDNEISDICNELGASRERISQVRYKLREIVNVSVNQAKEKSRSEMVKLKQESMLNAST